MIKSPRKMPRPNPDDSATLLRPRAGVAALPAMDQIMRAAHSLTERFGRALVHSAARAHLDEVRQRVQGGSAPIDAWPLDTRALLALLEARVAQASRSTVRPVFNLTGTVLHTNLGRAVMPEEAIAAVAHVMRQACNLEYNIATGERGERDELVEAWLHELTGAQAATVVNNNAAGVLLVLNTLAQRKEVVVSRGELIEIGGAFRIPDIMSRAGAKLREVGTTNRTHLRDYEGAIQKNTALLMKVHPSNFAIEGFTAQVSERELGMLARKHGIPFVTDLGSGSLVDFRDFGLPHEPTVRATIEDGADLVTFSGDKLLGGPQAGIIVGRADLIGRLRKNPLKRALRVDKMTLAALEAVLRLYRRSDDLAVRLTTLRLLTRGYAEIRSLAERLLQDVSRAFHAAARVELRECTSQIGSGSLPVERLRSAALVLTPLTKKGAGTTMKVVEKTFRDLPIPVIGRMQDGALWLDLRCLEDENLFAKQLRELDSQA